MIPVELTKLKLRPHPHVVILGAGASYAASIEGERYGRKSPLMKDLPDALELRTLLEKADFDRACQDFEGFYDDIVTAHRDDLRIGIEKRVFSYFDSIELSEKVTVYDKLVLALRKKDVIATFNWDPLLPYAYRRSGRLRTLPALLFLHGNVKLGYCDSDKRLGWNDDKCLKCGKALEPMKLLYPVKHKDYSTDPIIAEYWSHLEWFISNCYFVTIFGYSAPKTDMDARDRIIGKLGSNALKNLLQVEIIDPNVQSLLEGNLSLVVQDTHYGSANSLDLSWLLQHPRLSCEALYEATLMVQPIPPYRQPDTDDISELQGWAEEFHQIYPQFLTEGQEWQG